MPAHAGRPRRLRGITIRGRRYVYINAFRNFTGGNNESSEDWKHKAVIACDGGNYFWGALYDPETREFSDLSANGRI